MPKLKITLLSFLLLLISCSQGVTVEQVNSTPSLLPTATLLASITPTPETTPTPTIEPSPTPINDKELIICSPDTPQSLNLFTDHSISGQLIMATIYKDVTTLLKEIPQWGTASVQVQEVLVEQGTLVYSAQEQKLTELQEASVYKQQVVQFSLHPNLKWSNGESLTAQDVVYSFEWLKQQSHQEVGSQYQYFVLMSQSYTAMDDLTVEWRSIPGFITHDFVPFFLPPLHHNVDTTSLPIGWGAYRLLAFDPQGSAILEPNPYTSVTPTIEKLSFNFNIAGYWDTVSALIYTEPPLCDLNISHTLREPFDHMHDFMYFLWGTSTPIAWMNLQFIVAGADKETPKLFADPALRQAFAYAIKRPSEHIFKGRNFLVEEHGSQDYLTLPTQFDFISEMDRQYPFDFNQAIRLIDKATSKDGIRQNAQGKSLKIRIGWVEGLIYMDGYILDNLGVDVEYVPLDLNQLNELRNWDSPLAQNLNLDIIVYPVSTAVPFDCHAFFNSTIVSPTRIWPNFGQEHFPLVSMSGYDNEFARNECLLAQQAFDEEEIAFHTQNALQALVQDVPFIPIGTYHDLVLSFYEIENFQPNERFIETWNIEEWQLKPHKYE